MVEAERHKQAHGPSLVKYRKEDENEKSAYIRPPKCQFAEYLPTKT
jgi:hypothetical protein